MTAKTHNLGISTHLDVIDQFLNVKDTFVIDAGCGAMHMSKALAERGATVLAIDPDEIQAEKNRNAEVIPHVGFTETGADSLPVEDNSIDGLLFCYSLHHVPAELYEQVFNEALRVLKPTGYFYAIEPVAAGTLNDVMKLFHDEAEVRAEAQAALDNFGVPNFEQVDVITYNTTYTYSSWDEFASKYASKTFNADYTEEQIRADHVKETFLKLGEPTGFKFDSPVKVTWLRNPKVRMS